MCVDDIRRDAIVQKELLQLNHCDCVIVVTRFGASATTGATTSKNFIGKQAKAASSLRGYIRNFFGTAGQ